MATVRLIAASAVAAHQAHHTTEHSDQPVHHTLEAH